MAVPLYPFLFFAEFQYSSYSGRSLLGLRLLEAEDIRLVFLDEWDEFVLAMNGSDAVDVP
jgi:hypothetical protein